MNKQHPLANVRRAVKGVLAGKNIRLDDLEERSACWPRAIAELLDMDYRVVKQRVQSCFQGRARNFNKTGVAKYEAARVLEKFPDLQIAYESQDGMPLAEAVSKYGDGCYSVEGHILAIVDGQLVDACTQGNSDYYMESNETCYQVITKKPHVDAFPSEMPGDSWIRIDGAWALMLHNPRRKESAFFFITEDSHVIASFGEAAVVNRKCARSKNHARDHASEIWFGISMKLLLYPVPNPNAAQRKEIVAAFKAATAN